MFKILMRYGYMKKMREKRNVIDLIRKIIQKLRDNQILIILSWLTTKKMY